MSHLVVTAGEIRWTVVLASSDPRDVSELKLSSASCPDSTRMGTTLGTAGDAWPVSALLGGHRPGLAVLDMVPSDLLPNATACQHDKLEIRPNQARKGSLMETFVADIA